MAVLYFSVPNHAYAVDARTRPDRVALLLEERSQRHRQPRRGHIDTRTATGSILVTPDNHIVVARRRDGQGTLAQTDRQCPPAILLDTCARRHPQSRRLSAWAEMRSTCRRGWNRGIPRPARSSGSGIPTPRRGEPGIETWPNEQTAANGGGMPWQPPTYDPELNLSTCPPATPTRCSTAGGGPAPISIPRRSSRSTWIPER